jgi:hypothetical protein
MENKYIINLNTGEQEIAPSTPLPDTFNITELHTFYYYHFAPNFEFCGEAHDYYEFFVVVDGNMITKTNLGSFPLKEREFIIVPPNVNHAMIPAKSNSSCSCISLSFSCDRALPSSIALKKNVITDAELNIINMIANDYTNNFVNVGYLTQIFSPQKDQYAYKQLLKNAIEILLILIYRQFSDSNNTANKKGNRSQNKVEEVKSYLDAHSNEKISLTDLSAQYSKFGCETR